MIVAEHFGFVVGVDTYAKTHTLAIIDTENGGEEIANETFPAAATGGNRALPWILRRTNASPQLVLLSMEEQDRTVRNLGSKPPTPASKSLKRPSLTNG